MRSTTARHLAAGAIALAGCGSSAPSDPTIHHDAGNPDGAPIPPPPALGAQIDRMGRPLIDTMLIGVFAPAADQPAIRDAYSRAADPATWLTTTIRTNVTVEAELEANLAVFDAWDVGLGQINPACGNALRYQQPTPYLSAADLFGDDELYVDTARTSCPIYLALELDYASRGTAAHSTCGGRMPSHDVVDMTYSVLAAGLEGLAPQSSNYAPTISDGVAAHTDIKEAVFPFLGPPHP